MSGCLGSEAAVPVDGVGEERVATEQAATEDWEGGGGESEVAEQEVHVAGTAQDHQEGTGFGEGRQRLRCREVPGENEFAWTGGSSTRANCY